jgi:hypothetical protein
MSDAPIRTGYRSPLTSTVSPTATDYPRPHPITRSSYKAQGNKECPPATQQRRHPTTPTTGASASGEAAYPTQATQPPAGSQTSPREDTPDEVYKWYMRRGSRSEAASEVPPPNNQTNKTQITQKKANG